MTTHSTFAVGGDVAARRSPAPASPHARFALFALGMSLLLFLAMLLFFELGRQLGIVQAARLGESVRSGLGAVDGVVFAVVSLLLGFTFHGANTRFDRRRDLVANEVVAISAAWSRIETLPAEQQQGIRAAFRRYVDSVITSYTDTKRVGSPESKQQHADTTRAQNETWQLSIDACLSERGEKARMLLLPSLNEMFHSVEKERLARRMHPPRVIWVMLGLATLAAALFAGYSMSASPVRNWLYIVGTAATISIVTYVILELEYPRLGLIRVDAFDRVLLDLRATMG